MSEKPALRLASPPGMVVPVRDLSPRLRRRHRGIILLFVLMVLVPTALSVGYLYARASDQYHSTASFFVRSEEFRNPLDALSAFTQVGASAASDNQIIHDFITSQPLVEIMNRRFDLEAVYGNRPEDPVFALWADPSTEDLLDYWERMVHVAVDGNSGVIQLEVRAFDPEVARAISLAIIEESSALVNELSRIARDDAMRFALDDVEAAETRLRDVRLKVRDFRTKHQIIDPEADVESQIGVLSALHSELASALVRRQSLLTYAPEGDPRIDTLNRQIDAIRAQIESERASVGAADRDGQALTDVIGEYEELLVDLEFSEQNYTAALAAAEQARAEARRQSRYLAVHVPPTLAEDSIYPQRALLASLVALICFVAWSVTVLIYYNVRDRG